MHVLCGSVEREREGGGGLRWGLDGLESGLLEWAGPQCWGSRSECSSKGVGGVLRAYDPQGCGEERRWGGGPGAGGSASLGWLGGSKVG